MNREALYEKLTTVFREVFNDPAIVIGDETTAPDIPGWDSLNHVWLISAIEETFGVKFEMKLVVGMKNVGELVDFLQASLAP